MKTKLWFITAALACLAVSRALVFTDILKSIHSHGLKLPGTYSSVILPAAESKSDPEQDFCHPRTHNAVFHIQEIKHDDIYIEHKSAIAVPIETKMMLTVNVLWLALHWL